MSVQVTWMRRWLLSEGISKSHVQGAHLEMGNLTGNLHVLVPRAFPRGVIGELRCEYDNQLSASQRGRARRENQGTGRHCGG